MDQQTNTSGSMQKHHGASDNVTSVDVAAPARQMSPDNGRTGVARDQP